MRIEQFIWPEERIEHIARHGVTPKEVDTKMETRMKKNNLPKTDSIQKLAEFWDSHDLTDFEDDLEDVAKPVFVRGVRVAEIKIPLKSGEAKAVERIAQAKGLSREELVRGWVLKQIARSSN
jgi:hypothetical protein